MSGLCLRTDRTVEPLTVTWARKALLLPHVESKIKPCELHGRYLRYKQGKDMLAFFFQRLLPAGLAVRIFWGWQLLQAGLTAAGGPFSQAWWEGWNLVCTPNSSQSSLENITSEVLHNNKHRSPRRWFVIRGIDACSLREGASYVWQSGLKVSNLVSNLVFFKITSWKFKVFFF